MSVGEVLVDEIITIPSAVSKDDASTAAAEQVVPITPITPSSPMIACAPDRPPSGVQSSSTLPPPRLTSKPRTGP